MNASRRVSRQALEYRHWPPSDNICLSCRFQLQRARSRYASTVAAVADSPVVDVPPTSRKESSSPVAKPIYRIVTAVIVSRPPMITRDVHPFERAYHLYNRRLNERLALPFTRYFYYKKGTLQDSEWKRKVKARNTAARDIGNYNAYVENAWNDEVLVGDETGKWDSIVGEVYRDAEDFTEDAAKGKGRTDAAPATGDAESDLQSTQPGEPSTQGQIPSLGDDASTPAVEAATPADDSVGPDLDTQSSDVSPFEFFSAEAEATSDSGTGALVKEALPRPAPRITEADESNNLRSLSRKMDRTLYLLVKDKTGKWVFPGAAIEGREALSQAAERILVQAGGLNMNTWVVGNAPVAWRQHTLVKPKTYEDQKIVEMGDKIFFMKARIMTGQLDLSRNILGDTDFQWLAKEEVEEVVHPGYWASVKHALVEQ